MLFTQPCVLAWQHFECRCPLDALSRRRLIRQHAELICTGLLMALALLTLWLTIYLRGFLDLITVITEIFLITLLSNGCVALLMPACHHAAAG